MMRRRIPTVEESIARALVGLAPRSRELYAFYLRILAERHGRRKIDQLAASDVTELSVWAQAMAVRRSTSVSGASAREHAIAACRRLFDIAIADGHLQHNPAKAVRKPQRQESRRTALSAPA
jgi:integrase/recombinase XerC